VRIRDAADGPAWDQFVDIYAPLMYGFARKHGLQDADAADLTQDVLSAVSQAIRRLDYDSERGSFRGWLFTVVRNKLRDLVARRHHPGLGDGDTAAQRFLMEQPASEEDASAQWDRDYERRVFTWAADQIQPAVEEKTWQAFWRTAVQGQSAKETAAQLGMSVSAVFMAKSRVLARLKEQVQQIQETDFDPSEMFHE
jgi:RNA polymerase sigma-70 factor (ECF subfamily)